MYYRPREKRRHLFVTVIFFILLVVMTAVLVVFLGIYVGYFKVEVPTLAQHFEPTPTPTRPAILYVGDGDLLFAEGKLPEAVAAYERAIQIDPDNDVPYIRQSRLLIYTHNSARAVDRAAQAVLLNPTNPENLAYYCRALDWEAQYDAAAEVCNCAIELDPNYAEGYAFLAEVYADQGQWFLAKSTAQQAIDINFQSMDAHHNMGYALEVQGRYAEAVKFYENAITLAPKLAPLYVDAGRSYYWLSDIEKATDRFKKAIRLNPTDPEAYERLGWTYYTNGEYSRAIDALEQSVGVDPTYERGWGRLALVYYARQNFETAIELLPKAIELAEDRFLQRARQVEIYAEIQTTLGPEAIPVLRGQFAVPDKLKDAVYVAELKPVIYEPRAPLLDSEEELSCVTSIVQAIKNQSSAPALSDSLEFTQVFSQATGTATLELATGNLFIDLNHVPQPTKTPYELKVRFWPNRVDSVGYIQPDASQRLQVNIQFEEKLPAPIEYYYTLGLAYAYLDPPVCDKAVPYLLTALEQDSGGYNPAWYGLRICPSPNSPPTPIPTFTPPPEENQ
jgi:tetratricopeptide (TPR) repeat protein